MKFFAPVVVVTLLATGCERQPDASKLAIGRAKTAVSNAMRDPESAQFKNLRTRLRPAGKGQVLGPTAAGWVVCGEANGKNAFGGYVGYRAFRYSDPLLPKRDNTPFVTIQEPDDDEPDLWDAHQSVECDGADPKLVTKAMNAMIERMLVQSKRKLEEAKADFRRAQAGD